MLLCIKGSLLGYVKAGTCTRFAGVGHSVKVLHIVKICFQKYSKPNINCHITSQKSEALNCTTLEA
jgi:hypothetical protein